MTRRQLNVAVLLDNSFLDFAIKKDIDIGALKKSVKSSFGYIVVTDEVYRKAEEKFFGVYKDILKRLENNWKNLVKKIYRKNFNDFYKDYENIEQFICRLFNCMKWIKIAKTKEDLDLLVSAVILKRKGVHPIIVSDDKDIVFRAHLIFSYMGFALRIFSTFEFFIYLEQPQFLIDLNKYANYYNLNLNLKWLEWLENKEISCEELKADIYEGIRKGILSSHFSQKFLLKL
jgi:hypothetical protein